MAEYSSEIIADDANFQDGPWNFQRRKNAVKLPVELIRGSCVPGTSWFTLAHFVWISAARQIMSLYNYTIAREYSNACKLSQIYEVYLVLKIFNRTFISWFYLVQQFNSSELFLSFRYESPEEFYRGILSWLWENVEN